MISCLRTEELRVHQVVMLCVSAFILLLLVGCETIPRAPSEFTVQYDFDRWTEAYRDNDLRLKDIEICRVITSGNGPCGRFLQCRQQGLTLCGRHLGNGSLERQADEGRLIDEEQDIPYWTERGLDPATLGDTEDVRFRYERPPQHNYSGREVNWIINCSDNGNAVSACFTALNCQSGRSSDAACGADEVRVLGCTVVGHSRSNCEAALACEQDLSLPACSDPAVQACVAHL